ncbi:MAG: FCD domain-containing protein [Pseudomonadota bacterium]
MSALHEKPQDQPAYVRVFEAVETAILSGELVPGAPMPTEQVLCEQLGVQRSTVREGIRLLEQSGLAQRINRKRLVVARVQAEHAAEQASRGLERHGATFEEVWEATAALQPASARLAAERASAEDIAQLAEITEALQGAERAADVVALGVDYQFAIGRAARNSVINVMLRSLSLLANPTMIRVIERLPDAQGHIVKAQEHITAAICARDGDLAATWMARHIANLRAGFERAGIDITGTAGSLEDRQRPSGQTSG